MENIAKAKEEVKQKLLENVPSNYKTLKSAKQNLMIATLMPIIFAVATLVGLIFVFAETFDALVAVIYFIPMLLVFLIVLLNGRKKQLKVLNDVINKCTDNQINYRQYCKLVKDDLFLNQEIEKAFVKLQEQKAENGVAYTVALTGVSTANKAGVIQALVDLGCSISVANHAFENLPAVVFSNLTEEQALQHAASLENVGAKTEIKTAKYSASDEEERQTQQIKKKYRIVELVASVSVMVMLLLFALPIINVNMILAEYNCGIYGFIFGNAESQEGIIALLMSDFAGIEVEAYKNAFSLFNIFDVKDLLAFVSVISVMCVTVVYAFVAIVEIIGLVLDLFNSKKEKVSNVAVCNSYREKLESLTAEQLKSKKNTTIKMFAIYLLGKLVRIFLTIYFPVSLVLHITADPFVSVSPVVVVLFILTVLVNLGASCIKWLYSAKFAVELDNIDYLEKALNFPETKK